MHITGTDPARMAGLGFKLGFYNHVISRIAIEQI